MLKYVSGNILTDDSEALVNPVNCMGVMGRGLAHQFKQAFPYNFVAYRDACDQKKIKLGSVYVFLQKPPLPAIINFPTKQNWWDQSQLGDIERGLDSLVEVIEEFKIGSVAVPRLGCGLGGLRWEDVRPLIEQAFVGVQGVRVRVYGGRPTES